jgi:hypothetical protein
VLISQVSVFERNGFSLLGNIRKIDGTFKSVRAINSVRPIRVRGTEDWLHIVMCSIVLCVLNVCKPQEYPWLLRSYVNRKIDLIKNIRKHYTVHFNYLGSDVLLSTICRALETNAKVYKLSGCAETFSLNYYFVLGK